MLRIGCFGPATAPHHQALIQPLLEVAIGNDRELAPVPPAATFFRHRRIGGMYLMAPKLRAKVALRPMVWA